MAFIKVIKGYQTVTMQRRASATAFATTSVSRQDRRALAFHGARLGDSPSADPRCTRLLAAAFTLAILLGRRCEARWGIVAAAPVRCRGGVQDQWMRAGAAVTPADHSPDA